MMSVAIYGYLGLAVVLLILAGLALYTFFQNRRVSRQRLAEFGASIAPPPTEAQPPPAQPAVHQRWIDHLDSWAQGTSWGQRLRRHLARAAVPLTPGQFLLLSGAALVGGGALVGLVRQDLISALVAGLIAATLPALWVRRLEKRRARQFTDQLPNTLRVLIGSLRVGSSLIQAIEAVSELTPEPTRSEFRQVLQESNLGRPLLEALRGLAARMDSDEVRLMVAAMSINAEVGGNLIVILDTTAHIIRERTRLRRDIQVLNAQQILTGNMLMVLPVLVGGLLYLLNPDYMQQLFMPGPTLCIPGGAIVLMIVGYVLIRRILKIEV